ncbi:DUF4145 domain-containing protein [Xanthobacter oligotrophicus]|uniref:DUF4145 domain-containing protein n=1 Tax=Xanthobacter oligotrophicus TaxID=2607286 RepID=UPI001E6068B0|nr:DUF4145 domain-containing protein [Xanthobacter oligotrophicus]MCG5238152.1 DUF4145 domain-containing protein [Xanthobacter oligotrophicus]
MSNFAFLAAEFPEIFDSAKKAEGYGASDPRAAAFHARRTLELAVQWVYRNDGALTFPYDNRISALIHEPSFKARAGQAVFTKAKLIIGIGNRAVHEARETAAKDAEGAVRELFHLCFWLARTYAKAPHPARRSGAQGVRRTHPAQGRDGGEGPRLRRAAARPG